MKRTANIPRRREAGKGESGTALVMALFIITVLTVLGTMVLNTSIVEIKMAANQKVSSQVFYAAEAGLERGLLMMINDFENDTTANSPWANNNFAGWGETVTPTTMSGGTTFDPDVRSLSMYTDGNDSSLKKLTLAGGHTVNVCTFDLYVYNQGDSEAWVMAHAYGNGGTAAVEYHLRVDNVSPYNNAIFSGAGISGHFQGSVNVAGSMYSRGTLDIGAGVEVHNFYGGGNHPGNAMDSDLENLLDIASARDLEAKIRVKGGDLNLDAGSVQFGSSYLDTGTGEKGSLEGIYVDGATNIDSVGGPHYYDDHQSEVPDVPMPSIMDGLEDQFGNAYINSCISTQGYAGNDAAVATSLYADWVSGTGCWSASNSVGMVIDPADFGNTIDSSTGDLSYDDGLGNGLFYDDATDTLTIKGNVVINGDLDFGQSNGNDNITYEVYGDNSTGFDPTTPGTMFCNGNVGVRGNFSPDAATSGYLNPGQGINSLGVVTPGDITFSGKPGNYYTGFFYAEGQVNFNKQATLAGTVIGGLVNFAQVPDVYQVPNLKDYLPPAIPGGSDLFMLQNREWRRVY